MTIIGKVRTKESKPKGTNKEQTKESKPKGK